MTAPHEATPGTPLPGEPDAAEPDAAGPAAAEPGAREVAAAGPAAAEPAARQAADPATEPDPDAVAPAGAAGAPGPRRGAWATLVRAASPRVTRTQLVAALLCAMLGFAIVVQVSATRENPLTGLRQNELVRILDETTRRGNELEAQADALREQLDELRSGNADQEALLEVAEQRAAVQGILSGRLPAVGPGISIRVVEGGEPLRSSVHRAILEELRNAGAEVVQVNDIRIVASSAFVDTVQGAALDGTVLGSVVEWSVIGAAETLTPALEIPGGAMAQVRNAGATAVITEVDEVEVTAVREPVRTRWAVPVTPEAES